MPTVTINRVDDSQVAVKGRETMYAVKRASDGKLLGIVSKMRDTSTDKFPWQVFSRTDPDKSLLVCNFYHKSIPLNGMNAAKYRHGGKREAVKFALDYFTNVLAGSVEYPSAK